MTGGLRLALALIVGSWAAVAVVGRDCGMDNNSARGHILGGYPVAQNGYPWVVSIRLRTSGTHICAGTLISEQFVLTAGHCMYKASGVKRRASDFFIVVGAHRLNLRGSEESWLFARDIHVHPNYRSPLVRKWSHDLAIVELRNEHPYEKTGRPACLPTNEALIPNENCLVLGWGQTDTARYSNVLQAAVAPVISTEACNANNFWDRYVDDTMMCAGIVRSMDRRVLAHASFTQHGPGGHWRMPGRQWWTVAVPKRTEQPVVAVRRCQLGPVLCGEKPGVFTNLFQFGDWIRTILRKNGGILHEVRDERPKTSKALPRKFAQSRSHFANATTPQPPCDGSK